MRAVSPISTRSDIDSFAQRHRFHRGEVPIHALPSAAHGKDASHRDHFEAQNQIGPSPTIAITAKTARIIERS
ncbi:MAG: hypothetical protein IT381_08315 [Deltaproteobacteria bacterium]|nr:hypothetical protein [Deltaproteobacteria bacterium]